MSDVTPDPQAAPAVGDVIKVYQDKYAAPALVLTVNADATLNLWTDLYGLGNRRIALYGVQKRPRVGGNGWDTQ
jgi:hypothetical protein